MLRPKIIFYRNLAAPLFNQIILYIIMDDYIANQLVLQLRNEIEAMLQSENVDNPDSLHKLYNALSEYMAENGLHYE